MNYYNEFDKPTAAWLKQLIAAKLIPPGDVDDRDIRDVTAEDVRGYTQCHFFAGIGGWSYALRLAGWPTDRPVWTGSCPCQPFSIAGNQQGEKDERHLWPEFYRLLAECRPPVAFGEQVAAAAGRKWLAGVRADLESVGYAVGAADLCAASAGAPHIRQRLYWLAHSGGTGLAQRECDRGVQCEALGAQPRETSIGGCNAGRMGESDSGRCASRRESSTAVGCWDSFIATSCIDGKTRRIPVEPAFHPLANGIPARVVRLRGYGNAIIPQVAAEFILASIEAMREAV